MEHTWNAKETCERCMLGRDNATTECSGKRVADRLAAWVKQGLIDYRGWHWLSLTPCHWRTDIRRNLVVWDYVSPTAVIGTIQEMSGIHERRRGLWAWDAYVRSEFRPYSGADPIYGYAPTLVAAKTIVEALCAETLTGTLESQLINM